MADDLPPTRDYREPEGDTLGVPYLQMVRGAPVGPPTRLEVGSALAGRSRSCEIRYDVEGVSRKHARFITDEQCGVQVVDLGSHNGTFVNGQRIESEKLRAGDHIRLGPVVLRLVYVAGADAATDRGAIALSPREYEVAALVSEGLTNVEIGRRLHISPSTVGRHLSNIYERLEIHSRAALTKYVTSGRVQTDVH